MNTIKKILKFLTIIALTLVLSKCSPSGDTVAIATFPNPNLPPRGINEFNLWKQNLLEFTTEKQHRQ